MSTRQRGAVSLDIAITMSFGIGLTILVLSFLPRFNHWLDSRDIQSTIQKINDAAELSYREHVMLTRCISDSSPMSVQRLINEHRIPLDINSGLYTFETQFSTININAWSRPNYIETTVTFTTQSELEAVAFNLVPTRINHLTLTFINRIHVDISDNWSHFNKQTGCLQ